MLAPAATFRHSTCGGVRQRGAASLGEEIVFVFHASMRLAPSEGD
jgi:hypothetical protein